MEKARYPKKVRDLAKLEEESIELGAYANHNMHGLLQIPEYTRGVVRHARACVERGRDRQTSRGTHGTPGFSSACLRHS